MSTAIRPAGWRQIEPPAWDGTQACAGADPELFYAEAVKGGAGAHAATKAARALCRRCPWLYECLDYAVAAHEYGVWGGTTMYERATIRRRRNQPARASA